MGHFEISQNTQNGNHVKKDQGKTLPQNCIQQIKIKLQGFFFSKNKTAQSECVASSTRKIEE